LAFCTIRERNTEGVFAIPYSLYSTFLLWWIWPYALLTCQKSVWLTRNARQGSPVADRARSIPLPTAAILEPVAASVHWRPRNRRLNRVKSPVRLALAMAGQDD
jgi:hypothetical protein